MSLAEQQHDFDRSGEQIFPMYPGRVAMGSPLILGALFGLFAMTNLSELLGPALQGLAVMGGGLVGVMVAGASIWMARRRIPDRLLLGPDAVILAQGKRHIRTVKPSRLVEVNEVLSASGPLLLLSDNRGTIAVMAAALVRQGDYQEISHAIVEMVQQADPSGHLGRSAVAAGRTRVQVSKEPVRATFILAAATGIASFFATETLERLRGSAFAEEAIGAMSSPLLLEGETFRLFSYAFIHSNSVHYVLNALALFWLGSFLEKLIGWERMLLAFAAGVLGGALGHVFTGSPQPLVGMSGGVFGLLGLLGALATVGRRQVPRWLLPRTSFWVVNLSLSLLLPLLLPQISWAAHLGGALLGWGVGALSILGLKLPENAAERRHLFPFGVLALVALGVGALAVQMHPQKEHPFDAQVLADAYLKLPADDFNSWALQNNVAYRLLLEPKSNDEALAIGTLLAESAVAASGRTQAEMLDTLALARFRQGDTDAAIALLHEALAITDSEPLKQFLRRRLQAIRDGQPLLEE